MCTGTNYSLKLFYSKACEKRQLKIDKTKILMTNGCSSLMKVWPALSDIIGLENQFVVFLRVVVLHRFYCIFSVFPR